MQAVNPLKSGYVTVYVEKWYRIEESGWKDRREWGMANVRHCTHIDNPPRMFACAAARRPHGNGEIHELLDACVSFSCFRESRRHVKHSAVLLNHRARTREPLTTTVAVAIDAERGRERGVGGAVGIGRRRREEGRGRRSEDEGA
jgi:hypothetical protein